MLAILASPQPWLCRLMSPRAGLQEPCWLPGAGERQASGHLLGWAPKGGKVGSVLSLAGHAGQHGPTHPGGGRSLGGGGTGAQLGGNNMSREEGPRGGRVRVEAPPAWIVPGAPGPHRRAQPDPCPPRTSRTAGAGVSRDPGRPPPPIPEGPARSEPPCRHPFSSWWSWWSAADLDGLRSVRERSLSRHREAADLPSRHAVPGPRREGWGGGTSCRERLASSQLQGSLGAARDGQFARWF